MGVFRKKYAMIETKDGRLYKVPIEEWFTLVNPVRIGGDIDPVTRVDLITKVETRMRIVSITNE